MGCNEPQKRKDFYGNHTGWDIIHIPIIPPNSASSIDGGERWLINRKNTGSIPVKEFGVSKNLIYGTTTDGNTEERKNWFFLNVTNGLYAEYNSEEKLKYALKKFEAPFNPLRSCKEHRKILLDSGRCYWYPQPNEKYPIYEDIRPDSSIIIYVETDAVKGTHYKVDEVTYSPTNIYFFKVKFNKSENKLLYISIDSGRPVLIKDELIIPAFVENRNFTITVYTPFTVAQREGIKEEERIHIPQSIRIK